MSDIVIRVENLGKRYLLNHQAGGTGYQRFSESILHVAKAPLRWMQRQQNAACHATTEEFWALKDISFEVKQGEVIGIIGRNGAGKSTLLKVLSRITEPTTGRITLRGRVASLLEVGTGFHPELTGRENIYLNGAILGMTKAEIRAKFDEIVAFAEIERFLDTPVKRYSSGMYVRLAFAVAAHLEPEILIIDEVLAVGDAQFQKKCLGKMQDVATGGRTVLFVSHHMSAVRSLCHTGLLLNRGKVEIQGPIQTVIEGYLRQAPATADFTPRSNQNSYITSCEIHTEQGSTGPAFFTNDALVVTLRYCNERRITGLRAGFNIALADGTVLIACTPEDEGQSTGIEVGEFEAVAMLDPNILLKGEHQVHASVWNSLEGVIYDQVQGIRHFSIEAAKERAYACDPTRPGLMQVPARWSIKRL